MARFGAGTSYDGTDPIDVRTTGRNVFYGIYEMPEDGWVTAVGVLTWTDSDAPQLLHGSICLWDGGQSLAFASAPFDVNKNVTFKELGPSGGRRFPRGEALRAGLWIDPAANGSRGRIGRKSPGDRFELVVKQAGVPDRLGAAYVFTNGTRAIYVDYTPNATPLVGAWRSPSSYQQNTLTPVLSGTMPHPTADSDYDYSSEVHLQVWETTTGTMVYDASFATTDAEKANGYWSRSPVALSAGKGYEARFRHRDSLGAWSPDWSPEVAFAVSDAAGKPMPKSPTGKIDALGGYSYVATHDHPKGLSANAYRIRVTNGEDTAVLFDSGEVGIAPLAPGQDLVVPEFHADLEWETDYRWFVSTRDTDGVWSEFAGTRFRTNRRPFAPTHLTPGSGRVTPQRVFTCALSDPDTDKVTAAQIELVNASTGQLVPGYPKQMQVNPDGNKASLTASATDMVLGTRYRYRIRATDGYGSGYGPWSDHVEFLYGEVPVIKLLSPSEEGFVNLIEEPSAEVEEGGFWELVPNPDIEHRRVSDGDASQGNSAYVLVRKAVTTLGGTRASKVLPVDATRKYMLSGDFKTVSGTATGRFFLQCRNASGGFLADIYPSEFGKLFDTDPGKDWKTFGGYAGPGTAAPFPAGTAAVRVYVRPSYSTVAEVRYDAFRFGALPIGLTDLAADRGWHGYADGSTVGYGEGGYEWLGEEGRSQSRILSVLDGAGAAVAFSWSSGSGAAKKDDRLVIQRWDGQGWTGAYDTGYVADAGGTRWTLRVPAGALRNEGRYRLKVESHDSAGALGASDWAEVDVRVEGPRELQISTVGSDPSRATITLGFSKPDLTPIEFAAVEITREALDGTEPRKTIGVLHNPEATSFTDPFPVSGRPYRYGVRAVKNVGIEQVEGRYSYAEASVDYRGLFFVKDVGDPLTRWVAYRVYQNAIPSRNRDAPGKSFDIRGSKDRVHHLFKARPTSSGIRVRIKNDPMLVQSQKERYRNMDYIAEERPTICLLSSITRGKEFAQIEGAVSETVEANGDPVFEFTWDRTSYSEDYFELEADGAAT